MRKFSAFLIILLFISSCSRERSTSAPRTLLFSPITPEYLRDTAADWAATGFDGFLLSGIMSNWADDIWATDGDSTTRGDDDQTLQRVKSCNDACRAHGINDNFIKVAFYKPLPLWTDDVAWETLCQNFRQAARFAKMSGCRGIALDIEYVNEQYDLDWPGYDYQGYTEKELRAAALKRGRELIEAMLQAYPEMVFLNLPEGIFYYGPLAADFFVGMVEGMAERKAPGGIHLLTEHTYSMTSTLGILHFELKLDSDVLAKLSDSAQEYWKNNCSIALGGWPLGYYRKVVDEEGNFLGYSGRTEKFGSKIVGSYADKGSRFSPQDFRYQYAGLLLGSKRYCWIYGHGATWWHFTDDDVARYGNVSNSTLPVDLQLDAFKAVVREKWVPSDWLAEVSQKIRQNKMDEVIESLGFMNAFKVIGPFGCKKCNNFDREFPPEHEIDFTSTYTSRNGLVQWQTCTADPKTGYLDFLKYLSPTDWVCAYAYCKVIAKGPVQAQIRLGTNDTGTLWFNGEKLLAKDVRRAAAPDSDILPVQLENGENTILIKVCNTERNWGLYLRITDKYGIAIRDLELWP